MTGEQIAAALAALPFLALCFTWAISLALIALLSEH